MTPDGILNEAQKAALPDIVSALARRLAAVGEEASGLSNYYVRKLRHDVRTPPAWAACTLKI